MSDNFFRFHDLFAQLGLPNSPDAIAAFLNQHRPLPNDVLLADADFWDESQAQFIREKKLEDSPEWTQLIDQLSEALRENSGNRNMFGTCRVLALSQEVCVIHHSIQPWPVQRRQWHHKV